MRKKTYLFKSMAAIVALAIALASFGAPQLTVKAASAVNITATAQISEDGFAIFGQSLAVSPSASEALGFNDKYNGEQATALDALVAAHIALYGNNAASKMSISSSGSITKAFGVSTNGFLFFINGEMPNDGDLKYFPGYGYQYGGLTIGEALLAETDKVSFYMIQDKAFYSDAFAYFTGSNGSKIDHLALHVGETADLTLKGYNTMFGYNEPFMIDAMTTPIEDAVITILDISETNGVKEAFMGEILDMTDENGKASISFDEPGEYFITAFDATGYMPIVSPVIKVYVIGEAETNAASLTMPSIISGAQGTEFSAVISIGNSWPDAKAFDGSLIIPETLILTSFEAISPLSGGQLEYHADGQMLRFAYLSTSGEPLSLGQAFPAQLFKAVFKLKEALPQNSVVVLSLNSLRVIASSQAGAVDIDVANAKASATVASTSAVEASARILYEGNGKDLIPADKKAAAVEFANLDGLPEILYGSEKLLYSPELSENGAPTYVLIVDGSVDIAALNLTSSYSFGSLPSGQIRFGDTDKNNLVNSQDALNVISRWLRKIEAPGNESILIENVSADGVIDTIDALSIVENFVSGIPFIIVSK